MKKLIMLLGILIIIPRCFAQNDNYKDSIQFCYKNYFRITPNVIDHCITIWHDGDDIYLTRQCYQEDTISKATASTILQLEADLTFDYHFEWYENAVKKMVLYLYQKNKRYLILDDRVKINKAQLNEFHEIINEIKVFASNKRYDFDDILINFERLHYVIKDKQETAVIIDWQGKFDRIKDIEKVLGLKHYSRCPCAKKDKKQTKIESREYRKRSRRIRSNDSSNKENKFTS